MSQGDFAYKIADEWGLRVFPVIPQGKRPMEKNWSESATTDPLAISKIWARTPNANIGIATGAGNGIVVVDLDGDEAIAWFEGLEIPLGAEVHTPSGGKHYYYAIEPDVEIKTSVSEIHRGVDVRAEGGLVVGPGSVIGGKLYRGNLSRIPDAPEELLELLPRRQHFTIDPIPEGMEPVEAATEQERRELEWITAELDALERPWREGAGWRVTVFQLSCWLWRMVRSPHYALDESSATTLLLTHAPTDEKWGDAEVYGQWEDAKKRTAGQYAHAPLEARPALLAWSGFPTGHPFPSIGGRPFGAMWSERPKEGTGHLWQRRHVLLLAALKSGLPEVEAATLVWHSQAAKGGGVSFGGEIFLDDDSRCITEKDLWREVDQAKDKLSEETGEFTEAAPVEELPVEAPVVVTNRPSLLTDDERQTVNSPDGEWWGTRMMNWAQDTFTMVNEPYFRMNRWTVLSVIFGSRAVLPKPGANDRNLCIYQAIVGPTTSGKSEALRVVRNVLKFFYAMDGDTPDIGGNFTPSALSKLLIERDGKPSWFHIDEAHTKIHEWKKVTGPFSEMPGLVTELYDGHVGAMHRSTDKEISGKSAQAYMTVHLMGTIEGMAAEMGPQDWESGFLNRFVWAIGDEPSSDPEAVAGDWISEDSLGADESDTRSGTLMYQQWAGEFAEAAQKVGRVDGKPMRIKLPDAVIARHKRFAMDLQQLAMMSPYKERLRSTFRRLNETALRCAALVALSEGRARVSVMDLLIAIEQTEEWAQNILLMVKLTDEDIRTREINLIHDHLKEAARGLEPEVAVSAVKRIPRLANRSKEVDSMIGELVDQGYVDRLAGSREEGKPERLVLKGRKKK